MGGYQPPARPAPVSGPGPLSRRTDGPGQPSMKLGDAEYGEQKAFQQIQGGARMEGGPSKGGPAGKGANPFAGIVPLSDPTQAPDEPITAGAPVGTGPGPAAAGIPTNPAERNLRDVQQVAKYLPSLIRMANQPGVAPGFVRFVKHVREMSG